MQFGGIYPIAMLPYLVSEQYINYSLLLRPWDFSGKNTEVGCHFLLQGIFPTQGSDPGFPHCRQMLLPSEPPGSLHLNLIWMYQRFSCSQICNSHSLRVTTVTSLCPTAQGVHLPSSPLRSALTFLVLRLTFLRHCSLSHPPYLVSCQNFITISFSVSFFVFSSIESVFPLLSILSFIIL